MATKTSAKTSVKPATETRWVCNPAHSEIQFGVRHMMVDAVSGHFEKFNVYLVSRGDDFTSAKVLFVGKVNSLSSYNEVLAKNLKSRNFFDAENYPEISFESSAITKTDDQNFKMQGNLTIRGISKPVTLDVKKDGVVKSTGGSCVAFEAKGKIDRKDFGIEWGAATESGGLILSDDVNIMCNVEFVKEKQ